MLDSEFCLQAADLNKEGCKHGMPIQFFKDTP
jgi:hypothetical protein